MAESNQAVFAKAVSILRRDYPVIHERDVKCSTKQGKLSGEIAIALAG
jgi:hypothetical protein